MLFDVVLVDESRVGVNRKLEEVDFGIKGV
jgi:hypothetical protein